MKDRKRWGKPENWVEILQPLQKATGKSRTNTPEGASMTTNPARAGLSFYRGFVQQCNWVTRFNT